MWIIFPSALGCRTATLLLRCFQWPGALIAGRATGHLSLVIEPRHNLQRGKGMARAGW
jgi:hypothetical protein